MRATSFAVLSAVAITALAGAPISPAVAKTATVIIETAHGGAHNDRTNATIAVPIGPVHKNEKALAAVSTLYLLDPIGATCTPFKDEAATEKGGLPFTVGHPSLLSTKSVVIGSLVCTA
ncbi:hypothetical protein F5Y03DRAFT_274582 [Xylaria venustula]|nr:hypothetical protein F5Y03DRAFT_274582 [Xylaria venustula]